MVQLSSIVAVVVTLVAIGYDAYLWRQLTVRSDQANALREEVAALASAAEAIEQRLVLPGQRSISAEPGRAGAEKVNDMDLLLRVASDSDVQIVSLFQSDMDSDSDIDIQPTYRLRLRADMDRLIGFLRMLEDSGLHRVVIDRVAAKRQGNVWDADLELTSYIRPDVANPLGRMPVK